MRKSWKSGVLSQRRQQGKRDEDEGAEVVQHKKDGKTRLVVREGDVEDVIQDIHSRIGHLGINNTTDAISRDYYWKSMTVCQLF